MTLRVLLASDAPWAPSGYAVETRLAAPRLAKLCDLALLTTYGLHGARMTWNPDTNELQQGGGNGIPVYPGGADPFANDAIGQAARDWKADIIITLKDSFVFRPDAFQGFRWMPLTPIDHEPIPPSVVQVCRAAYRPIAYAPNGFRELRAAGFDPCYAPHACFDYDAKVAVTEDRTEKLGDIATGKVQVDSVLGVGRDGHIRPVRITSKYVIPHKDKYAVAIRTQSGRSFIATRDNDILTDQGWVVAGLLNTSMYVILGNIHSDERQAYEGQTSAHSMDAGRNSVVKGSLCHVQQSGDRGAFSRSDIFRSTAIRTSRDGTNQDIRGGFRRETQSDAPNINTHRISLSSRDIRWGRTFLATKKQSGHTRPQADSTVYSACGSDQSIRSADRMDVGAPDLVTSQAQCGQGQLGMGISTNDHWTRGIRVSESPTPVFSDQGSARKTAHGFLRTEGNGGGECAHGRTGRGDMVGASGIEWSEELTRDAIVSVTQVHLDMVYDLTTETSNFLVDEVVVHNCDPNIFYPMPRAEARKMLGLPDDIFIVGTVAVNRGGIPSRKAWPQNLEAFAQFRRRHEDAFYLIHTNVADDGFEGGIPLRPLAAQLSILDRLIAPEPERYKAGFPDEYMRAMYNSLDVLNAVSVGEGFGIPQLEAQACGIPVITSDFAAARDLCFAGWKVGDGIRFYDGQASYIFIPRPEAIADALEQAYATLHSDTASALKAQALAGAAPYQIDRVVSEYWRPLLEEVERDIRSETSRGVLRIVRREEVFA